MKICLLTTSFPRHANDEAGIFIARLQQAFADLGIDGTVIAPYHPLVEDNNDRLSRENWSTEWIRYRIFSEKSLCYGAGIMPNLRANPFLLVQIPALLLGFVVSAVKHSKSADLLHANWIFAVIPALIAVTINPKPLVATIRGEDLRLLSLPILGFILRALLERVSQITTVSEEFRDKLSQIFPNKKIICISNGVSINSLSAPEVFNIQAKKGLNNFPYLIFSGRLIRLKRIELLLELLRKLEHDSVQLLLCGSVEDSQYVEQLKVKTNLLGISQRVHFLGSVDPQEYLALLSGASFYCSASDYEGRPNSVLEAIAHGVPSVLSGIKAHKDLFAEADGAYFFDSDLSTAAGFINRLLRDSQSYQELSQTLKSNPANKSWKTTAEEYKTIFKQLLAR